MLLPPLSLSYHFKWKRSLKNWKREINAQMSCLYCAVHVQSLSSIRSNISYLSSLNLQPSRIGKFATWQLDWHHWVSEITWIMCIIFVDFHLSLAFWDYFLRLLKISLRKLRTKPRSRKSQMKSLCWGGLFLKYFPKSMLDPWTWLRIMNKEFCKSLFLWSTTNMPPRLCLHLCGKLVTGKQ